MNSTNIKKKVVIFASIVSLGCFAYLNLFVNTEVAQTSFEAEIEQEEQSSAKIIAPDLKVVNHFMEVSGKILRAIH